MDEQQDRLMDLFNEARAKSSAEERAAYLESACGADTALRRQVEVLLRAEESVGDFLQPTVRRAQAKALGEGPGTVIGRYRLLQEIGEGGFGVVFMAEQLEPIQRKVALKIIKAGMDTLEVIARFEAERQALALMDHPNIARVLDAGATESGRPYFVMELVKGIRITDYCDQNNLSTEERLGLFIKICHAVQHAHQKGIIHRDLKPSNVMITLHDGEAVPKVIDFGIAKATGRRLTQKTLFTRYEQMVGTPVYMSPEQAEMSGTDVDTRTDIYALGVLLYELLTGVTPIDKDTLAKVAFDQVRKMICETEPAKPSTRLHTLGEKLTEVAKHRQTVPGGLQRMMRGDLDWIVMKALEKDRRRRYETANDFAVDIQRHIDHQPVVASPPGTMYRARKFVRRHRVGALIAVSVTVALLAGLSFALLGLRRALKAESATRTQRDRAVAAEAKAQDEAAIAAAVNRFLLEDLLWQGNSYDQPDRADVKLRSVLDAAAQNVEARFQDKPLVEAEIRLTLAEVYGSIGETTNARAHLDHALAVYKQRLVPEDPRLLVARRAEVCQLQYEYRFVESQALVDQLLPVLRRVCGPTNGVTLNAMQDLAIAYRLQHKLTEAQKQIEEVLSLRRQLSGLESRPTLECMLELARVRAEQGYLSDAQKLQEEVLAISRRVFSSPHHSTRFAAVGALGFTYMRQGNYAEAQKLWEEYVSLMQRLLGDEAPATLAGRYYLATSYMEVDQPAEAQKRLEELLPAVRRVRGAKHPATLRAMSALAVVSLRQGKLAQAQVLLEEVLPLQREILGDRDEETLLTISNLAFCYGRQGRWAEAQKLSDEALSERRRAVGPANPDTSRTVFDLASALTSQGKWVEARPLYEEAVAAQQRTLGHGHPETLLSMNNLAWMLATCADPKARDGQRAVELAEKVVATTGRTNDTYLDTLAAAYAETRRFTDAVIVQEEAIAALTHPDWKDGFVNRLNRYQANYAEASSQLLRQGKLAELEAMQRKLLDKRRVTFGKEAASVADSLAELTRTLLAEQKYDQAESLARECLQIREKARPDDWGTFEARSLLGACFLGQKKYSHAETVLRSGYERLRQREDEIPPGQEPLLNEALQHLIQLYEATDRHDQVAECRQKLAELEKLRAVRSRVRDSLLRAKELSQKRRWQEAKQIYEETLSLQRQVLEATDTATLNTLKELGALLGSMGDWPRAMQVFEELIALQPDDHWHYYRAHAAALAVGRMDRCRELSTVMLKRFGDSQDWTIADRVAKSCLLTADGESSLQAASALANRNYELMPDSPWIRTTRAIAEYRHARFPEAVALLQQPRNDPNADIGCLAAYFYAMARHQQGNNDEARELLEHVNQRFAEGLGPSDLSEWWDDRYRNVAARGEAERLILGHEASPRVTVESLAQARERWDSVRELLVEGAALAQKAKWKESRDKYVRAMDDSVFLWQPAEQQSPAQGLASQMAIAFVKAGDGPAYQRLCRLVLGRDRESLSPRIAEIYAEACVLNGKGLSPELRQQALALARHASNLVNAQTNSSSWWASHTAGIAEYYAGNFPQALELLAHAAEPNEEWGVKIACRGGAMVFRAMTLKQMGRKAEARQVLAEAEALLAEPIRTRAGAHWWDLEICQLALDEARQLFGRQQAQ